MKELFQVWGRVAGRTYSAVNRNENGQAKHKTYNKTHRRIVTTLFLSLSSLLTALFIYLVNPYELVFNWKASFSPGGEIFEMWRKPEVDLFLNVYLFNVTNPEEFMAGNETLKVEQIGPYVYKEHMEHGNVTFNENGTLSSIPIHPLEWKPELSYPRTQEDIFYLPNIAMLSLGHVAAGSNYFTRMAANALLRTTGSKPIERMTAWDFMFGYQSNLVSLGNSFLPGWIKFDKLGLIDRMYDFENDFETVYSGHLGKPELAGLLDTWRGSRNLPHWEGECGDIHKASDGAKFPGELTGDEEVLFYRKSLCRSAPMVKKNSSWIDGLWGYEYVFHKDALDNGLRNKKNKCFCRHGNCLPDGLIDVTDCYYGFPIALSYPHFLDGAPELNYNIRGLHPDRELHSSSFMLQPKSGLPLRVAARFQINMALFSNMKYMHSMAPFSNMTLPLLWFEFRLFSLPERMVNLFKLYLNILPKAERCLMWILFAASPLLLGWLLWTQLRKSYSRQSPPKMEYNPRRRSLRYANTIRKMSLDIEAKLQGVYAPCETPLNTNESSAPFLNSIDLNTSSDSDDKEQQFEEERRPSLVSNQVDKIKDMGKSLGNRIQGNIDDIKANIKNYTSMLNRSLDQINSLDSDDANNNEGFVTSESCQSSGEEETLYKQQLHNTDDEDCHVEIMDDGSEFDIPLDAGRRRRSVEIAMMEKRMNLLDLARNSNSNKEESVTLVNNKEVLARLPYLPEEQV